MKTKTNANSMSWYISNELLLQITPEMADYYLAWTIKQMDYINDTARSINQRISMFLGASMVLIAPFLNWVIQTKEMTWAITALILVDISVLLVLIVMLFPRSIVPKGIRPQVHITEEMLTHIGAVPASNPDYQFKIAYIEAFNRDSLFQERSNQRRFRLLRLMMLIMTACATASYLLVAFGCLA